jgi:hypothetical protein
MDTWIPEPVRTSEVKDSSTFQRLDAVWCLKRFRHIIKEDQKTIKVLGLQHDEF